MSLFGPPRHLQQKLDDLVAERDRLRTDLEKLHQDFDRFRLGSEAIEVDRYLLLATIRRLRPGMEASEVGEIVAELAVQPLGLASCFLALLDRDQDILSFPHYYEGGKSRKLTARRYSDRPGITGHVLQRGAPLYTRNLEDSLALGAILTEAEKASGLVPQSWYGVPLGFGTWAAGIMAFEHYQVDAFPESRRQTLDALGRVVSLALTASGAKGFL